MDRRSFFDVDIDALTLDQTVELIKNRISDSVFTQHVVVNVAKLVNLQNDSVLSESVKSCDIINADGMGIVWGSRFLGMSLPERVAGIDLFYKLNIMAEQKGFPVFYLGAQDEVVQKTADVMQSLHPKLNIVGTHHGYFWDDERAVVEQIAASGARLLFVAITSPKKENFINRWKDELGVDFVMGVGGTFDVVAGKVNRAPLWMQKYGLEWFYRVIQEPRRMWRRYLVTNTTFAFLLIKAKFGVIK